MKYFLGFSPGLFAAIGKNLGLNSLLLDLFPRLFDRCYVQNNSTF